MNIEMWALFFVAYLGITLSPGPNVFLVLTHAAKYGLPSIATTIFANLSCQLIIITLVGLGVGALLTTQSMLYHWIKYMGALYLIYLGLKVLYKGFIQPDIQQMAAIKTTRALQKPPFYKRYTEAFAVSASNPKTIIFLSAFLPQFITPEYSLLLQFTLMYLSIAVIVVVVHGLYSLILVKMKGRINQTFSYKFIPAISAIIYVSLGIKLGLS